MISTSSVVIMHTTLAIYSDDIAAATESEARACDISMLLIGLLVILDLVSKLDLIETWI